MKQTFLVFYFLLTTCYLAKSQTVLVPKKIVRPKAFILKLQTEGKITTGYLSGINDSLIQLSTKRVTFSNSTMGNPSYGAFPYAEVETVKIRKYGSIGRGIGFGALIGAGVGGIIGLATYQRDPNSWFDLGPGINALAGAIIGAILGIIFGGIRGAQMKKFSISRNKENFEKMSASILEMALSKNGHAAKN
ncbi:MAG: hypothetical protein ABIP35_14235 [Ginsengibacter sp.]